MKIIPTNLKFSGTLAKRTSTDFIILHHAAALTADVDMIHKWHLERKFLGFGYNFLVRKSGEVYAGRPIDCADSDAFGHNFDSLSICFEGDFDRESMSNTQMNAGSELIRYLLGLYPQVKSVVRHRDVDKTSCPGKNFPAQLMLDGYITLARALETLKVAGIINTPDYWSAQAKTVEHLDDFIFAVAKYVRQVGK
jgi:hypothetical protein